MPVQAVWINHRSLIEYVANLRCDRFLKKVRQDRGLIGWSHGTVDKCSFIWQAQ